MEKMILTEEEVKKQIALLNKVKQLFLLPEYDCLTLTQAAEYFEVSPDCIKRLYQRHKAEFDEDGVCLKYPADFKIFNGTSCPIKNMQQEQGKLIFDIDENTQIIIPNRGIRCFPKYAIVRMGMMLTGSRVSKEVRNKLLDFFEGVPAKQKVESINSEQEFMERIAQAMTDGDVDGVLSAYREYKDFASRQKQRF